MPTDISLARILAIIHCAKNIVRWWMNEHHEHRKFDRRVCFLGDVLMPRGLVPMAIWLSTREYTGIWRFGSSGERERSSIFFRGYRYALRDQDTTWLAACGTMHRGYEGRELITMGFRYGLYKVRSPACCVDWCILWFLVFRVVCFVFWAIDVLWFYRVTWACFWKALLPFTNLARASIPGFVPRIVASL